MLARKSAPILLQFAKQYPIITLTGPRQSGKTTLAQMCFPDKPYLSLEDPDTRRLALDDPRSFLERYPNGAIIDEVQQAPDLFSYIQTYSDKAKTEGRYILTGSQQFGMMERLTQSLAGRTALSCLLPLSVSETKQHLDLNQTLFTGGFPRIYDKTLNPTDAMRFYVQTYLERDVRTLINIKDMRSFELFLGIIAGRSGQLANTESIANDCGITHNTVKSWLSILEASYIIKLVAPYHSNQNKRLIKMPKIFFLDTGLLCYLLGIFSPDQLTSHPLRGSIFETFVFTELYKTLAHQNLPYSLFFYRDYQGHEVDFLIDCGSVLKLIEVKASSTYNTDQLKGIRYLSSLLSSQTLQSYVVYAGAESFNHLGSRFLNWRDAETALTA